MDYKRIVGSRRLRLKILELLAFIPDRIMIKLQYRIKTGRKLNLKNPQRFTEKLQWYKLYYKNPLMIKCVDKYEVREYVRDKGLGNILIPCLGVYERVEDIEWGKLPRQFVLKDTLGGGGAFVEVVKDYKSADIEELKRKCAKWIAIKAHRKNGGREWPYYSGKRHRVIVEHYVESNALQGGLIDYKFFCFNGKCHYLYVIADRELGNGVGLGIFDPNFERLDIQRMDEHPLIREVRKPVNYDEMLKIAETLAGDFPEVRVDLYSVEEKVLFGELTFFDGSGYMSYKPDKFDFQMGNCFQLPEERNYFR